MASSRIVLPATMDGWRELTRKALALPRGDIRVPPQFCINLDPSGAFVTTFGPAMPAPGKDGALRTSAIVSVLMPLHAAAGTNADGQRRMAGLCSDGGAFRPAGQPEWPAAALAELPGAEREFGRPVAFDGLDVVIPLTMRPGSMRAHSGQMALPGGRCDPGETVEEAALREAREEVGLDPAALDVVGQTTRLFSFPSKAFVHPCVAVADEFIECHAASPDEVESVHFVSLGALIADARFHHRIAQQWKNTPRMRMPAYYATDGAMVWGLTAFALGELVARVGTVLGVLPRIPKPVLTAWGDNRLVSLSHVAFKNPYDAAAAVTGPKPEPVGAAKAADGQGAAGSSKL